ncbi:cell division protein ZipA [Vibrio sp. 10N.286.49.B3]|uniref:cell division protein ZipA n=1 Tax=Vibrio sp. 10N.286.49.B3 TaxID=1880855 RepID=UPI000C85EBBA|nr:cell division protein ZipA [Vibrio sp. 10N.286.49.B3]PMH40980.1 cell division protein ZipA [Vibrio sp. 10N.286.49.B3]
MPELRIILIVVGALAIAALLFHGLWTSKKDGKAKFADKPFSKLSTDEGEPDPQFASNAASVESTEPVKKQRKEPDFGVQDRSFSDPLVDGMDKDPLLDPSNDDLPSFSVNDSIVTENHQSSESSNSVKSEDHLQSDPFDAAKVDSIVAEATLPEMEVQATESIEPLSAEPLVTEPEMQVLVLNVHCSGHDEFIGSQLFASMTRNGLTYGDMDIFHCHVGPEGTGKIVFSVANMMQPGTLAHTDPAQFSTKGISFFMTLPCYGDAEQNFNLMLTTAQQIADDMSGNVLDDARNLLTPDRLAAYRRQVQDFNQVNQ